MPSGGSQLLCGGLNFGLSGGRPLLSMKHWDTRQGPPTEDRMGLSEEKNLL